MNKATFSEMHPRAALKEAKALLATGADPAFVLELIEASVVANHKQTEEATKKQEQLTGAYRYALIQALDGTSGPHEIVENTGLSARDADRIWNIWCRALENPGPNDEASFVLLGSE